MPLSLAVECVDYIEACAIGCCTGCFLLGILRRLALIDEVFAVLVLLSIPWIDIAYLMRPVRGLRKRYPCCCMKVIRGRRSMTMACMLHYVYHSAFYFVCMASLDNFAGVGFVHRAWKEEIGGRNLNPDKVFLQFWSYPIVCQIRDNAEHADRSAIHASEKSERILDIMVHGSHT